MIKIIKARVTWTKEEKGKTLRNRLGEDPLSGVEFHHALNFWVLNI